jgi:hypothetical protein
MKLVFKRWRIADKTIIPLRFRDLKALNKFRSEFYCNSNAALTGFLLCFLSFIKADKNALANKVIADPRTIRLIVIALLILKI